MNSTVSAAEVVFLPEINVKITFFYKKVTCALAYVIFFL